MDNFKNFADIVSKNRQKNICATIPFLSDSEKQALLKSAHPDFNETLFGTIEKGKNAGEKAPKMLCEKLNRATPIYKLAPNDNFDLETDVLVLGSGGAGLSAAITANEKGAKVILATKHTLAASNTTMAKGGISASLGKDDSPEAHFYDTFLGGDKSADKTLVKKLADEGSKAINWLTSLGVNFDADQNGNFYLHKSGGASKNRLLSVGDSTGKAITAALIRKVKSLNIEILENCTAVSLLTENNVCFGAVLTDKSGKEIFIKAKSVVLTTGGMAALTDGPTTNHKGAVGDGLVLGYNAGCELLDICSLQYHPTGIAYPYSLFGSLVTEKARSLGAMLLNCKGEPFVNSLEGRDVVTAAIISECRKGFGIKTEKGHAVLLDTAMIDVINGQGTCERELPTLYRFFQKIGIDITKEPILVSPTLHYQNGGIKIDQNCRTGVKNLYAAGEITGGIHGKNRLMGNSLLEIIVFGITAGETAAKDI